MHSKKGFAFFLSGLFTRPKHPNSDDPDTLFYAVRRNDSWVIEAMTPGLYRLGFFRLLRSTRRTAP